ncbi:hypothetical protein FSP39_020637 [Pinctada imbricata]|uniref:Uncharacterized protein n=1 Tax=Pinctada imbricata TaxID=66713 RepID=A0AA88YC62_PINIB|nr:hypothetical protein FSP39_020637 [Pinctada imbricata]
MCGDVFQILVQEGDNIEFNEEKNAKTYSTHVSDERRHVVISIPVYSSTTRDPCYTTDAGCSILGEINVNPPENGWPENTNDYSIKFQFGRTELFVSVHDTTNDRQYDATFDMLG